MKLSLQPQTALFLFLALFITSAQSKAATFTPDKDSTDNGFAKCIANPSTAETYLSKFQIPASFARSMQQDAIYLEADSGSLNPEGLSRLDGNIVILQNKTLFRADSATLNRSNNTVSAQGNVTLLDNGYQLKSPKIEYNLKDRTGKIQQAEYIIGDRDARGSSTLIEQLDQDNLKLSDASYTSCPVTQDSWSFRSKEINLNRKTQIGQAKNVTFNVGKVPVFFFPWLRFPLNKQRLSGFLTPSMRLQSNAGIRVPYYFNLAPNYDATVGLTTIKDRGYQIDTEFRYLTSKHAGQLEYDLIPQDKSRDDDHRDYFKIQHTTRFAEKTRLNLKAEGVSDVEYFEDFSTSLEESSRTELQRRLEVVHDAAPWTSSVALEDYQIIDATDSPYAKLPELKLRYAPRSEPDQLKFSIDSELSYFEKSDAVTGSRADVKLKASKKWGGDGWYFKPSLSLQNTLYSLNNAEKSELSRLLPTVTIDTGLFFDRMLNNKLTQTLEPRIFYTHTPYEDQSDFPVFDSAVTNFSASNQLFLENRFTGKDRIADTNQLTFAISSKLQDRENGRELFKASIGQIFHFDDRKVTLDDESVQTDSKSELVLELTGRLSDNLRLASTSVWDSSDNKAASYDFRLNYRDNKKRIANIGFRKLDTELKQVSLSGGLPINDQWSMVASVDHDIKNKRNLESLLGFEYQDCCWKTRLVVKRYLSSDNINYDTPVFLEFELKGLGNLGTGASRQIKEKIYGYDDY